MAGPPSFADVANGGSDRSADQARLRTLFLQRLSRLMELAAISQLTPAERRLVNYALYSTYWDCARLGIRDEAGGIIGLPQASAGGSVSSGRGRGSVLGLLRIRDSWTETPVSVHAAR